MHNIVGVTKQSPPVDTTAPYSTASLAGKTVLLTGAASGFGAAFARHWAQYGATLIIGDINRNAGAALATELNELPRSSRRHAYVYCDVTDWQSQVDLFKKAAAMSPGGVIHAVVPCAGIADGSRNLEQPRTLNAEEPRKPKLNVVSVNLIGVLYTVHLALFWLQKRSKEAADPSSAEDNLERLNIDHKDSAESEVTATGRDSFASAASKRINGATPHSTSQEEPSSLSTDRHILIIGSMASLAGIPGSAEYTLCKHALLGLFRSLKGYVWLSEIRLNMLCPYFVETPILTPAARMLLAGGNPGKVEDVVDAATRLVADESINGHALLIGPKLPAIADMLAVEEGDETPWGSLPVGYEEAVKGGQTKAVWEAYAHSYESVELFSWRYVQLLNNARRIRGWIGTIKDLFRIWWGGSKRAREGIAAKIA
jgi:NAD(P)-dependent dehydrogenase (short-subunit alcohol dehydrogenase family)